MQAHSPILIADDYEVTRKIVTLLLRSMGLSALTAIDGKSAVEVYSRERPALIFMDIQMPEMDGFEATRKIRRHEFGTGRHTPVIAFTALDDDSVRQKCIDSGMDDYIPKPTSQEELKGKLELWLGNNMPPIASAVPRAAIPRSTGTEPLDIKYLQAFYGTAQVDEILAITVPALKELLARLSSEIDAKNITGVYDIAREIRSASYDIDTQRLASLALEMERSPENWPEIAQAFTALALAFNKLSKFHQSHVAAVKPNGR